MKKIKQNYECSLSLNHDLIGGKWKLQILWHIIHGENRYSMLEKAIAEITPKVLSSQLKELVESGIIIKDVIDDMPPKIIVYNINEKYQMLVPIIQSIHEFTNHYATNENILLGRKCCISVS